MFASLWHSASEHFVTYCKSLKSFLVHLTVHACPLFSHPFFFLKLLLNTPAPPSHLQKVYFKSFISMSGFTRARADMDREQFKEMNCSKITTTNLKHDAGAAASI